MVDLVDRARAAVTDRADLPGMSLLEHLDELRKRIIRSAAGIILGFFVAYGFHAQIFRLMQEPITTALAKHNLPTKLTYLDILDPFNMYLKIALIFGCILASPWVLYQVWMFISPGLYKQERRYVVPFMSATVGLFLAGAWFGYHYVYPGMLDFLLGYSKDFTPNLTIDKYTSLFATVILGLGITFELPILVFFLALFGIVNASFLWRNFRYAVLIIFIIAGIITPTPDVLTMCLFALPMLGLYTLSILVAYMVHPSRRKKKLEEKEKREQQTDEQ
jgi:sec-independent protein translocase protein TatC